MSEQQFLQHHAQLLLLDNYEAQNLLVKAFCNIVCPLQCNTCPTCISIQEKRHPWIFWLNPEPTYTLEAIDAVLQNTSFLLDAHEQRFFVFMQADQLTSACCNRLLKTIEEPHRGYYFLFVTNRPQDLLPTLRSRCLVKQFTTLANNSQQFQDILQPFINLACNQPISFMKLIEKQQIKEAQTKEIVDQLFDHFYKKLKESVQLQQHESLQLHLACLGLLKKALLQLPASGSHKIFWKNLYISFHKVTPCLPK